MIPVKKKLIFNLNKDKMTIFSKMCCQKFYLFDYLFFSNSKTIANYLVFYVKKLSQYTNYAAIYANRKQITRNYTEYFRILL